MKNTTFPLFGKLIQSLYIFCLIFVLGFHSNGNSAETIFSLESRNSPLLVTGENTNSPPNANSDSYTVHGDFQSNPASVLDNDSDPDGDALHIDPTDSVDTSLGRAGFYYNGRVSFSPSYGATGSVTVPYTVCDSYNACTSSTVTFNIVNQNPSPGSDLYNIHGHLDTYGAIYRVSWQMTQTRKEML